LTAKAVITEFAVSLLYHAADTV